MHTAVQSDLRTALHGNLDALGFDLSMPFESILNLSFDIAWMRLDFDRDIVDHAGNAGQPANFVFRPVR